MLTNVREVKIKSNMLTNVREVKIKSNTMEIKIYIIKRITKFKNSERT